VPQPLLVTGGTGYLGAELLRQAAGRPLVATHLTVDPVGADDVEWIRLDVRDSQAVLEEIERVRPAAVIHTAYRQEGEGARETTLGGAAAVAAASRSVGARLLHLSSDVIFDGTKPAPYDEDDSPSPITDYGRAKAEAERAVSEAHPGALLARTSLLYGGDGESRHELLALAAARGDRDVGFFDDELRCPVLVGDLAAALIELVDRPERGVLNLAGAEVVTRYEFACLVARAGGLSTERIRRTSIAEAGLERPRNCALATDRARSLLGTQLRGARECLLAGLPRSQ
jgi:dTDP-4-dehydrorhamnose reductase